MTLVTSFASSPDPDSSLEEEFANGLDTGPRTASDVTDDPGTGL